MIYTITRTRVFEASSRHAPLPVVQFQLGIAASPAAAVSWEQFETGLQLISATGTGGVLALVPPEEVSPVTLFACLLVSLSQYAGSVTQHCKVQPGLEPGSHDVFIDYEESETTLYAGELAAELLNSIWQAEGELAEDVIERLVLILDEFLDFSLPKRLDSGSRLLMQAARQRGIPVINLDQPPFECSSPGHIVKNGYIQFGWGVNMQRCDGTQPSDMFPHKVLETLRSRALLMPQLQQAGIPVPGQDLEFTSRNQLRRAQRSAQRIGFPVTVCPVASRTHEYRFAENNVFEPLQDDAQLAVAVSHIREVLKTDVWLQAYVEGDSYQFLVAGNEVVSVVRLLAPSVTGDGKRSIRLLLLDRAGSGRDALEYRLWHDLAQGDAGVECRLQLAGLTLDSVLPSGDCIALRAAATSENGGICEDVTEPMPQAFKALALEAARVVGVSRYAGINLTIRDATGEAALPNCALTGVVHGPDLQSHETSRSGHSKSAAASLLEQLFTPGENGRIPIAAITGTNGKTTTSRMVVAILQQAGLKVGLSCSDGVYVDGERLTDDDSAGARGALLTLVDPDMQACVLETARGGMATSGIAFDRCDVGACLNIQADHLGLDAIDTLDAMAEHKRQVIERTAGVAVLNAEDPRCLAMREHSRAQNIILVAKDANHPEIIRHCEAGGEAIVLDEVGVNGQLCVRERSGVVALLALRDMPATWGGLAFYNAENAMFAAAVAMGLELERKNITAGLRGFSMSMQHTPGRLNVFEGLPFRLIFDYAHNAHGIKAFCDFTDQLQVDGRRLLVIAAAGDRSVEEIEESAASIAGHFDYFICRDPYELRGRSSGEVPALLKAGLVKQAIPGDSIEVFTDKEAAIQRALDIAESGDLLVVFAGKYYVKAWETAEKYKAALQHDRPVH